MDFMLAGQGAATPGLRQRLGRIILAHLWFKTLGTTGFLALFFAAYLYLLHHPVYPVRVIPATAVDAMIGFTPLALPVYVSLWLYVSLPAMLCSTRGAVSGYGAWMAALCLSGLAIFYFWPNAVPPAHVPWEQTPGMSFLKNVDAAGNACPSLHVGCAVFAATRLHQRLPLLGLGRAAVWGSALWCLAIAWSTLATKQHVALDVLAGVALGGAYGLAAWRLAPVRRVA
jgi:membrane-associated phospholipid phosphatase